MVVTESLQNGYAEMQETIVVKKLVVDFEEPDVGGDDTEMHNLNYKTPFQVKGDNLKTKPLLKYKRKKANGENMVSDLIGQVRRTMPKQPDCPAEIEFVPVKPETPVIKEIPK
ncbi:hypothetical protein OWV82_008177 [Melia azedarach]|uniref:Uncharacterized protein n=1 Tax=Melia azedarach TaxID=155640 RepID=A0ACC1YAK6_MELAZ|nr:hypothetical protein OWV82_008177 [Melia azedarach]